MMILSGCTGRFENNKTMNELLYVLIIGSFALSAGFGILGIIVGDEDNSTKGGIAGGFGALFAVLCVFFLLAA